jgi:hypothetical protein
VKFADFELISRSRTLVGAIGSRDELGSASAELLGTLFPLEKAVRLLGVAISGFAIEAIARSEQIAFALGERLLCARSGRSVHYFIAKDRLTRQVNFRVGVRAEKLKT